MENWRDVLVEPAKAIFAQAGQFVVGVLLVILILIIGWIVAKIIKMLVTRLLKVLKLDDLSKKIGLSRILAKGGIDYSLSTLVGVISYWLILLVTFVVGLNAVGLTIAAELLQRMVLFVPNIIVAIFILVIGMFVAAIMQNIVKTTASNAGISYANLFGKITQVVIMVFAVGMALSQLQIGARIIELSITIILGSLGLGFSLALGLGCKDIVAKAATGFLEKLENKT